MPYRPEHKLVYEAARDFAQRCLLGDTSLLWPERTAWTAANVAEVKRRLVDSPVLSGGSFDDKLLEQMRGASAEHWIIIADVSYVYYLPSIISIKLATKQQKINWAISQASLPPPPASAWEAQKCGFVRTGQLYHMKYAQFWLILLAAQHIKQQPQAAAILADPQRTQAALDAVLAGISDPQSRANDMRHALLFMLFPDRYERIINTGHKDAIIRAFGPQVGQPLPADRDSALIAIRAAHSARLGEQYDYYDKNIRPLWDPDAPLPPPSPPPEPGDITPPPPPEPSTSAEVARVLKVLAHTRNVVLYGPPGTGKTFIAGQVAEALVRPQLQRAAPEAVRLQRLAGELSFYELLAVAIYQAGSQRSFPVTEILQMPLVQARLQTSPVAYPRESVWNNLQSHTSPDSSTVRVTRRIEPYLFDKDADSRWHLTPDGRSYVEKDLAGSLSDLRRDAAGPVTAAEYITWTTFHQSYAYEDFVEGIRPQASDAGDMTYPVVPGSFREISHRASTQPDRKFVLVIDEINRGNIAKIFGELITLLEDDKRGRLAMRLPYSGQAFTVPPNLYVIGTMNTTDRSIALLDVALRRRFAFVELTPQLELLAGAAVRGPDIELALDALLRGLNARIRQHLGRDYEIGHSYLLKVGTAATDDQLPLLEFVWNNQIVPLLHEYFYGQPDKLQEVLAPFASDEDDNTEPGISAGLNLGRATGDELLFALDRLSQPD
jgi:5-methylcytosine-specific restriction protein B